MPRDSQYMKDYYKKNKHKWIKRTPEKQAEYNEKRRKQYAEDPELRKRLIKSVAEYKNRKPHVKKKSVLKTLYGMTIEQFEEMKDDQDGRCAICGIVPSSGLRGGGLHVDHDHKTNIVRGLLCGNCNHGLGKFRDDTQLLLNAINYLKVSAHATAI